MLSAESVFRQVEEVLDEELNNSLELLSSNGIEVDDNSGREYHYKNNHLFWSVSFIKKWSINLETAKTTVTLSYFEPASETDKKVATLDEHYEVYSQGKESRISGRRKQNLPLEEVKTKGIGAIVLDSLNAGVANIEQAL